MQGPYLCLSHLCCAIGLCPSAERICHTSLWKTCSTYGAHNHGLYIPIDLSCSEPAVYCIQQQQNRQTNEKHVYFGV